MKYCSTRDSSIEISGAQAIVRGLSADGGLFVPKEIPHVDKAFLERLRALSYEKRAAGIMRLFLEDFDEAELEKMAGEAYASFDAAGAAPVRILDEKTGFLELWHGPTCAFKDMALQLLPRLLTASLKKTGDDRKICILVATSGDTGKAALEGFRDVDGTAILVFYPRDGVSDVQKLQMQTQEGQNVSVCGVLGNFDDAQTGVKQIFGSAELASQLGERGWSLSSANSINWGRLLPQIVYYFSSYCDFVNAGRIRLGDEIVFSVPTGNFGDILAGWYAKQMGLPVKKLLCASNENSVLTEFLRTGRYDRNREFFTTISPSMDILISSNLERLLYHLTGNDARVREWMELLKSRGAYEIGEDLLGKIRREFDAEFCTDPETLAEIGNVWTSEKYLLDTHTAVASAALEKYRARTGDTAPAVVVSTASPFKFCDAVLRAIGTEVTGDGLERLDALERVTGLRGPEPLRNLRNKTVRFTGYAERNALREQVELFLERRK